MNGFNLISIVLFFSISLQSSFVKESGLISQGIEKSSTAAAFLEDGYKVGDLATDFKLKNVDGKMVSLADYADAKGFIVVFTCNHCPFPKPTRTESLPLTKNTVPKVFL